MVEEEMGLRMAVLGGREVGLVMVEETRVGLAARDDGRGAEARMLVLEGSREVREKGLVVESPFRGAAAIVVGRGVRELEGGGAARTVVVEEDGLG